MVMNSRMKQSGNTKKNRMVMNHCMKQSGNTKKIGW